MTYVLILTLLSNYSASSMGNSSQNEVVFYAQETCEAAKAAWLQQFRDVKSVKPFAMCAPRSVSQYGSITLDKQP